MAMNAGKAVIELSLLSGPIDKQLNALEARLQKFGSTLSNVGKAGLAVGSAITGAFAGAATAFVGTGSALDDLSQRTGVGAATLSELGYAAEQSGTNLESLGSALFRMRRRVANAALGTGPAVRAFEQLGINAEQLTQLPVEQQFKTIADALSGVGNESEAAQYGFEILGDGFKALMPLVTQGSSGIEALQQKARALGITMSTEDAQAAGLLGDAMDELWAQVRAMTEQVGAAVAGPLTDFLKSTQDNFKGVIDWIKANRELMAIIATLGAAIAVTGAMVFVFGHLVTTAAMAIKALRIAITFLSAHPMVALITLIAGVVVLILHWTGALDKLIGRLGKLIGLSEETNDSASELNKTLTELSNIKPPDLSIDIPDVTDLVDMPPIAADVAFNDDDEHLREEALNPGAVRAAIAQGKAIEGLEIARQTEAVFNAKLARQTLGDSSVQDQQLRELKGIRRGIERQRQGVAVTQ